MAQNSDYKPWVDADLQEPLIGSESPPTLQGYVICENKAVDCVISTTNQMLPKVNLVILIILLVTDATLFFLLKYDVISVKSTEEKGLWINVTIQVFMVLYTYGCVAIYPTQLRKLVRTYLQKSSNVQEGTSWEGENSSDIFDYIPAIHRLSITLILNIMCVFQFINQGIRFRYITFEEAQSHKLPIIFANIFFISSVTFGILALLYTKCMKTVVRMAGKGPDLSLFELESPPASV